MAADLLARRPWTAADLQRRLARRGAPRDLAAELVADLVRRGHVDDAAFARQWVAVRAPRGYGPARLRAELRARGVEPSLVESAVSQLTPESDLERARALARRRLRSLGGLSSERAAARVRDHLLRRGFGGEVAARIAGECVSDLLR